MDAADKIPVLVIAGPTGVGKTLISVRVAQLLNGEIISADSAQVYRGLDIGTAKIREDEQEGVPHHLLNVVDPDQPFSVAQYQSLAQSAVAAAWVRGHLPIVVGGTGLWIRALLQAYAFPDEPQAGHPLRTRIEAAAQEFGWTAIRRVVRVIDPGSYAKIAAGDTRRLTRALEIWWSSGKRLLRDPGQSPYRTAFWVLTRPMVDLHRRLAERVDVMVGEGLVAEVIGLLRQGVPPSSQSLSAIGYHEVVDWYRGKLADSEYIPLIKRHSEQYAKRQLTWFRSEKTAHWLDLSAWQMDEAVSLLQRAGHALLSND